MIHSLWPQSSLPALDGGTTVKEQEVSAALVPVPTMPVPKSYDVRQLHRRLHIFWPQSQILGFLSLSYLLHRQYTYTG